MYNKLFTLNIKVVINLVSKIYPRGIQFKNLSSVSNVTATNGTFCELSITNWQSWNICENSLHIVSFKCFAFVWVICPLEKSNTSSDKSFKIAILFWQRLSLVLLAPTISLMKDSQFFGHSRFNTWYRRNNDNYSAMIFLAQDKNEF